MNDQCQTNSLLLSASEHPVKLTVNERKYITGYFINIKNVFTIQIDLYIIIYGKV